MKKLVTASLLLMSLTGLSQRLHWIKEGGGKILFKNTECISKDQEKEIQKHIDANRIMLLAKGIIKENNTRITTVKFEWPLRLKSGENYPSFWGISNFVDHDRTYPFHVLDYNCGSRTYDQSSGYNHSGTDIFLWPFSWKMMDSSEAEIIAAAPGTILYKSSGNYDRNCGFGFGDWNAVYILHDDGTVAWYGHMKNGSLTKKNIGQSVITGEYLGTVGSSGNSTGPHLHFEVHNSSGDVIDPWNGSCNALPSMWKNQKPYYDPYINRIMTHSAAPVFPDCPGSETVNEKNVFTPGDPLILAAYLRDQQNGDSIHCEIITPGDSVISTWDKTFDYNFPMSFLYWEFHLPSDAQEGVWKFKASMNSQEVAVPFMVINSSCNHALPLWKAIYNPEQKNIEFEMQFATAIKTIMLYDASGNKLQQISNPSLLEYLNVNLVAKGIYILCCIDEQNCMAVQKIPVY